MTPIASVWINTYGVAFPHGLEPLKTERKAEITITDVDDSIIDCTMRVRYRGNSSLTYPKRQYRLKLDKKIPILGMPADKDWILYAPSLYDRVLLNNPLVYELSRMMGRYAPRTRWCEGYVNDEYMGLFVLTETIKRGKHRVNIPKGKGWIRKIDRGIRVLYPKPRDLTADRSNDITTFMNDAVSAAVTPYYSDYFDVQAAIDHHIINALVMSADAFKRNLYMFRRDGEEMHFGPVWDYDKSLSTGFRGGSDPQQKGELDVHWPWNRLFTQAHFVAEYTWRYLELRNNQLGWGKIESTIDRMADEIRQYVRREYNRNLRARFCRNNCLDGTFQGEVNFLKDWLSKRLDFMDKLVLT